MYIICNKFCIQIPRINKGILQEQFYKDKFTRTNFFFQFETYVEQFEIYETSSQMFECGTLRVKIMAVLDDQDVSYNYPYIE